MENVIAINTARLDELEAVIQKNIGAFYEVGRALMEIRDSGLYRDVMGYDTFEAYCKERWDMSRRHAYRLMESFSVVDAIKCDQLVTPATESQTRPLARLEPDQQRTAWQRAVETAPEGKVTAAHVSKVVKELMNPEEQQPITPQVPTRTLQEPTFAMEIAVIAISQLERIHPKDPKRIEALTRVEKWIQNKKGGK